MSAVALNWMGRHKQAGQPKGPTLNLAAARRRSRPCLAGSRSSAGAYICNVLHCCLPGKV